MGVLAGDRDRARAHHGQWRVVRRRAFSTRRNFLATYIRHRPCFRVFPSDQRALMRGVIAASLGSPLVSGIGQPPDRDLLALAARVAAVALPSVVGPAHHEPTGTVTADQREDIELVHPSRTVENWTAISETTTVSYVLARPSTAGTSRAQVAKPGPSLFPSAAKYRDADAASATSRAWSPGPR